MTDDVERCDECGAAASNPHRLRCPRYFDEQEAARAFEDSGAAQGALIGGVVAGIVTLVLTIVLFGSLYFSIPAAAAVGGAAHEVLRRMAERNRKNT